MPQTFRNKFLVIKTEFFLILSLSMLMIPFWWIVGWFFAVFFHEICHYMALRFCNVPVFQITVGAFGVQMLTDKMSVMQEIVCAIAGPLGGLLLFAFLRIFPYVSLCAFVQSLFNLIPIFPMDGGRVVEGICIWLFGSSRGSRISKAISVLFIILLACVSLIASTYYKFGLMPMIVTMLVIVRSLKTPCKERQLIVQ